jgi:hypothetical protein
LVNGETQTPEHTYFRSHSKHISLATVVLTPLKT